MTRDALGTAGGVVDALDHRLAIASTVTGLSTATLDVRTGVFAAPGSLALVTGTSATAPMTVNVAPFQAVTARTSASGAYLGPTNEATQTVTIGAAPGANSRIDVVWVKQQDADATVPTPDVTTAPLVSVTAGTAAASPTKPAIPVGALELATVTVAVGATSTNGAGVTIANTARQTVARGGIVPVRAGDVTPGAYSGAYRDIPGIGLQRWDAGFGVWGPPTPPVTAGKRVIKTGTQSIGAAWVVIGWDTTDALDPGTAGMWTSGSNITAPAKGIYAVTCSIPQLTHLQVRVNAAGSATGGTQVVSTYGQNLGSLPVVAASGFLMNASDYVTAFGLNTSTQSAGAAAGGYIPHFSLTLIAALP